MRVQSKRDCNLKTSIVEPSYWDVKDQLLGNEWEELSQLIRHCPGQVLKKDCTGGTLLHQIIGSYSSSSYVSLANLNNNSIGFPARLPPHHVIEHILDSIDAPLAIASQDREGLTPLHLCCQGVAIPDKITISLAKRNPTALAIQDEEGDTPLHSAFRFGASNEVIKALIDVSFLNFDVQYDDDDSSCFGKFDYEGDTPLHKAILHEASCSSIQLYLDAYPQGLFTTNCKSQTPLHIACVQRRYDIIMAISQSHAILGGIDTMLLQIQDCSGLTPTAILWHNFTSSNDESDRMGTLQSIACLLLPNVDTISLDGTTCFYSFDQARRLMETSIKLGSHVVPEGFVSLLIQKYSKLVCSKDDQGRLPIHKVATQPLYWYDCGTDLPVDESTCDSSVRNEECFEPETGSILNIIYSSYPEGAHQYDNSGKLPTHVALEEGLTWQDGVKCISRGVLRCSERSTGLYPFMLAAVPAKRGPCLETIFQLLRGCPDLITIGSDKKFERLQPRKRQRR